jgi:hydroxyacylglutathione hydrolase
MFQVKVFFAKNNLRNFSYLIVDQASGLSWVIDPFDESPIIHYIKKESLILSGIFNTHQHWDHIRGNSALQNVFNCSVITKNSGPIKLGGPYQLEMLATPGHTQDHEAFCCVNGEKALALFSGDTLFNSGVGNCKSEGANVEQLFETTNKLKCLGDDVILYPGHDYVLKNLLFAKSCEPENSAIDEALKFVKDADSEVGLEWTLGQEKKVNPFLRLNSEEMRQKLCEDLIDLDSETEVERHLFKKLRSLRDNW